jgi:hypothetical protein
MLTAETPLCLACPSRSMMLDEIMSGGSEGRLPCRMRKTRGTRRSLGISEFGRDRRSGKKLAILSRSTRIKSGDATQLSCRVASLSSHVVENFTCSGIVSVTSHAYRPALRIGLLLALSTVPRLSWTIHPAMRRLFGKKREKEERPRNSPVQPLREHAQPTSQKHPPKLPVSEKTEIQNRLGDDVQQRRKGVAFASVVHVDEQGELGLDVNPSQLLGIILCAIVLCTWDSEDRVHVQKPCSSACLHVVPGRFESKRGALKERCGSLRFDGFVVYHIDVFVMIAFFCLLVAESINISYWYLADPFHSVTFF